MDQPLIPVFYKVIIHLVEATVIQFNLIAIYGGSCLYGYCKSYFTRGSIIQIACQRLSNVELFTTKVNGFQCKAIAIKSSILDIAGIPDPPLITIFGKVTFSLMQATVISFNLIAIYGRSYLYGNCEIIFSQRRI